MHDLIKSVFQKHVALLGRKTNYSQNQIIHKVCIVNHNMNTCKYSGEVKSEFLLYVNMSMYHPEKEFN